MQSIKMSITTVVMIANLTLGTLTLIPCYAQDLDIEYANGTAKIETNIEFENISRSDLYTAINKWVISVFNSPGDVIKKNLENTLVEVEGIEPDIELFKFPKSMASLRYVLSIETNDNKLIFAMHKMIIITDLNKYTFESYMYNRDGSEFINKQTKNIRSRTTQVANVLFNSLNTFFAENNIIRKWN